MSEWLYYHFSLDQEWFFEARLPAVKYQVSPTSSYRASPKCSAPKLVLYHLAVSGLHPKEPSPCQRLTSINLVRSIQRENNFLWFLAQLFHTVSLLQTPAAPLIRNSPPPFQEAASLILKPSAEHVEN